MRARHLLSVSGVVLACAPVLGACSGDPDPDPRPEVSSTTRRSVPRSTSATTAPAVIVGSGQSATEDRDLGAFTGLVLDLPADVEVRVGATSSLTLEADDNLLGAITTEIVDGSLVLGTTASFSTESGITVAVGTPSLDRVEVRGSGSVEATDVTGPDLEASIRGSGSIRASGAVQRLRVTSSGSGSARLFDLSAEEADVAVDGSGAVEVTVSRSLRAVVTGSGTVVYGGNPSEVTTDVNGSGSIPPR